MERNNLINAALAAGAAKATIIDGTQIVLSEQFRRVCESNQCGGYAKCWMCPPYIGPIGELMAKVRSYPQALLYQTIFEIEDSYDIEGMFEAGAKHAQVSQNVQKEMVTLLKAPFLHLACGGCHLCPTCAKRSEEPCRFPEKALPSMEGYGVDVYNTTKDTPLQYINGQNTVTYFSMVLFSE
ncbi:MAG: DUF2284 domain-containing protein [Faecousia sp.]